MTATVIEPFDELRKFEPVSDAVVLAALDRAERHRRGAVEGVMGSNLAEHLGFVRGPWTARGLRPQLDALIDAGALERTRRQGMVLLVLTEKGRTQAAQARRTVALPESPQHRAWRQTRKKAVERIDGLRGDARRVVQDAGRLLDAGEADSEALFLLAVRLKEALQYLGSATYCAREWAEPDDARADTDDDRPPWYSALGAGMGVLDGTGDGGRGVMAEHDAYTVEHERLLLMFGEKLRAERDRLNVSQDTLAGIANVHRTHLSALELGLRDPHLSMLLILADTLEVVPSALLEGLPVPRERKAPTHFKNGTVTGGEA